MSKPAFNPNAAFDVVDSKPAFNPNAPHEIVDDLSVPSAAAPAPRGKTVYRTAVGPNPELSGTTARSAVSDLIHQTPQGSRTFIPENPEFVEGVAPLAIPVGGALLAGSKLGQGAEALANLLGRSAPARVGASTLVGAAQDDENRLAGAAKGLLTGVGGEALAKGFGTVAGAFARPAKTLKYVRNPVIAQDAAKGAVESADDLLRTSQQAEADRLLADKSYRIDPRRFQGSVPEADDAIREAMANRQYPDLPSELEIPAQTGERIRQALDASVKYPKNAAISITPEIAAKHQEAKALADSIRAQRSQFGGDDAAKLYGEWSENLNQAQNLERSARNAPVSALTRPGTDSTALRMRIDSKLGTDLQGLGEQLRTAEQLRATQGIEGLIKGAIGLGKESARGAYRGAQSNAASKIDPLVLFLQRKLKDKPSSP